MHSRSQPAGAAALTDRVEMDAVGSMKVRKPYGLCSTVGSDCSQSHCCKVTNTYCWKTDTGGGQCETKSKPGWPGQELEGTDTIVSVDSANIGNSLFCFSVYRKNKGTYDADDQALDLLKTAHKFGEGVFACDAWRVFSDSEEYLGDYKVIVVKGDDFFQSKRPETGGWGGGQWINTPMYMKIWASLRSEYPHGWHDYSWTVKVDADTVFLPDRLSARLKDQPVPATGVYIEHCQDVDYGFFGSMEVMSKTAAKILFENAEKCYNGVLPWKTDLLAQKYGWDGEDLFAQKCMDFYGVGKIWQFDLMTDGTCPMSRPWTKEGEKKWVPDPVSCSERDSSVGFKPLKSPRITSRASAPSRAASATTCERYDRECSNEGPGVRQTMLFFFILSILSRAPCRRQWFRNLLVPLLPAAPVGSRNLGRLLLCRPAVRSSVQTCGMSLVAVSSWT